MISPVDGSKQFFGTDYDNTYAPVVTITSIRICIALTASSQWKIYSIDVCNAYANIIIKLPENNLSLVYPTNSINGTNTNSP